MAIKAISTEIPQNVFIVQQSQITFIYSNLFLITRMAIKVLIYGIIGTIFAISGIFGAVEYLADTTESAIEGDTDEFSNDTGKYFKKEAESKVKEIKVYAYLAVFFAFLSAIAGIFGFKL